ncbi:MAG: hypothetical protein Q8880_01615 [Bacteroidota bacterium]|nr:hypothetical protein [Bacteroidota bacterium]
MKRIYIIIIILLLLYNCNDKNFLKDLLDKNEYQKTFLIKKGDFSPDKDLKSYIDNFTGKELQFEFWYDNTGEYKIDSLNKNQLNKIYGFYESGGIEINSARFASRWDAEKKKVEIFCYVHNDKAKGTNNLHIRKHLCWLNVLEKAQSYIKIIKNDTCNYYEFNCNGNITRIQRTCKWGANESKGFCYPYFGGNVPAPHDLYVYIDNRTTN